MIQPSALIHAHGQSRRVLPPYNSPFLTAAATPNFSKTCSRRTFNSIGAEESSNYHSPTVAGAHATDPLLGASENRFCCFFPCFFVCKKTREFWHAIFSIFSAIFTSSGRSNVDFHGFRVPKQLPGGSFFEASFGPRLWTVFLHFFSKKRNNAKHEKVDLSM